MLLLQPLMKKLDDYAILDDLKSAERWRNDLALSKIYDLHYNEIARHIFRNGGTTEDSEDVFQEALIILYEKVRQPGFVLDGRLSGFLLGISKNIWLKKLRRLRQQNQIVQSSRAVTIQVAEEPLHYELPESRAQLMKLLSMLNEDCRTILRLYYFERLSMAEIAKRMGYNNAQVAKNKKSRCMQLLRQLACAETKKRSTFPKEDYEK